jgi:hypothetical protein
MDLTQDKAAPDERRTMRRSPSPAVVLTTKKKFPIHPARPERTCWGCDRYCAADAMLCGNGSERTQHPAELFGEDWADLEFGTVPAARLQEANR